MCCFPLRSRWMCCSKSQFYLFMHFGGLSGFRPRCSLLERAHGPVLFYLNAIYSLLW